MEVVVTTGAIMTCKAPVKMSPSTNQHPVFFTVLQLFCFFNMPDAFPVAQPTVSALKVSSWADFKFGEIYMIFGSYDSDVVLETKVLVLRRLEDKK